MVHNSIVIGSIISPIAFLARDFYCEIKNGFCYPVFIYPWAISKSISIFGRNSPSKVRLTSKMGASEMDCAFFIIRTSSILNSIS